MRRAAHIDANQPEIVQAFLEGGCTVQSLASIGLGCPDLLVGYRGVDFLAEVKNPDTTRGQKQETVKAQAAWRKRWQGRPVSVVSSATDARLLMEAIVAEQRWQGKWCFTIVE
jgi:hypothetical protein